ncbi:ADP-ribose glycohydrolase OARD1 [Frankliniella fusca]|uniref:ADP-ribose glycohydrolase OARD1 n=1 Tax=Frankliniella fusca TaxID=407009 RepID=A0AAE1LSI1_9NEOP|nr:ADP-ribose glycohydrolase OARD1 [Frankliniella fusca]
MGPVRGEKVQQVLCDLFSAPDDHALAHCVGADLRMGKGIAVDFRVTYGNVDFLKVQGKVPGEVAVLPADRCGRAAPIFYLVSKKISSAYGPHWEDFCSCLQELRRLCEEMGIKKVAMPRIVCFDDHLSWPKVEEELYSTFQSSTVSVLVFYPPNQVVGHRYPLVSPPQPTFMGWQVLGDSNVVRFCVSFGCYSQNPRELFPNQLGLCISGQRMKSLHFLITLSGAQQQLLQDFIIMIGTNDIIQMSRFEQWMGPPGNIRHDGIHFNHQGLSLLHQKLIDFMTDT